MTTYQGGCHCGKVRYEVDLELGSALECNCSHCAMKGLLLAFVPDAAFRPLSGEAEQTEYRFNKKQLAHLFCPVCGVQSYSRGENSKGEKTVAINLRCLDGVDADTLPRHKYDGKSV